MKVRQGDVQRETASEKADDSGEMLSDGNWTPACCSLGSLLMNRRERGQQRGDGKEDMRKPSCVMYGHDAKMSISFTKPLSRSDFNLLLLKKQANKKKDRKLHLFFLLSFHIFLLF